MQATPGLEGDLQLVQGHLQSTFSVFQTLQLPERGSHQPHQHATAAVGQLGKPCPLELPDLGAILSWWYSIPRQIVSLPGAYLRIPPVPAIQANAMAALPAMTEVAKAATQNSADLGDVAVTVDGSLTVKPSGDPSAASYEG